MNASNHDSFLTYVAIRRPISEMGMTSPSRQSLIRKPSGERQARMLALDLREFRSHSRRQSRHSSHLSAEMEYLIIFMMRAAMDVLVQCV